MDTSIRIRYIIQFNLPVGPAIPRAKWQLIIERRGENDRCQIC